MSLKRWFLGCSVGTVMALVVVVPVNAVVPVPQTAQVVLGAVFALTGGLWATREDWL